MNSGLQKAIDASKNLLTSFGIDSPPVPLVDIIAAHGLNIVYADFSTIPSGNKIAGFIDLNNHKIFVNKDDPPNRQRFTIAHELGHFILHPDYIKDENKYNVLLRMPLKGKDYSQEEKEANCFAAYLLVPSELLKKYKKYPNTIIASLFTVSEEVVKYSQLRTNL